MPRNTIENIHQLAKAKGIKCLSSKYKTLTSPLEWQCSKGHIWKSPLDNIRKKTTTCPECQKTKRNTDLLNRMQLFAKKRGGICLSTQYINSISPLKWKCKNGHIWKAAPCRINDSKEWCKKCSEINRKANKLALLQKTAKQHSGKCLSDKYVNIKVAMNWQCKNKHVWNATPERILNGHWCSVCNKQSKKVSTLNEMQKLAKKYGGKCLSTEYINATSPLKWQCQQGHQWEATPIYISDAEIWCKKCNKQKKATSTLVRLQKIAKKHGGECLSKKYINMKSPMRWQCKNGHIWTTRPDRIVEGRWCTKCKKQRKKKKKKSKKID